MATTGFCVKCKLKREMVDEKESKTSRGVRMMKGKCKSCNTKMCRMMGK
jgi:hypothetical protein